jgi:hypothetical protein
MRILPLLLLESSSGFRERVTQKNLELQAVAKNLEVKVEAKNISRDKRTAN